MAEDKQTENYETVLDRIFIRYEQHGNFANASLKEMLKHQDQLKKWIKDYLADKLIGLVDQATVTEIDLQNIIEWMDNSGIPPVRIRE